METRGTSPASAANFRMIDIGEKCDTQRRAVASGFFFADRATIQRIRERTLPKGDVLTLAEVAGIQGAKKTSDLLPLCHPLALTSVRVWHEMGEDRIQVFCEARTVGKTGVEMEALSCVSAALLCIYDLTKGIDPVLRLGEIKLEIKEGGKSGRWVHPSSAREHELVPQPADSLSTLLRGMRAVVLTMSDRSSRHESEDRSGPIAKTWLIERGAEVIASQILPDDSARLASELGLLLKREDAPHLIVTSGGTGLSPRDITPETVLAVAHELGGREAPGLGELLRMEGSKKTQMAWLSRSTAVLIGQTLIVCLPGSPAAVSEGLETLKDLIGHALHVGAGGDHPRKADR